MEFRIAVILSISGLAGVAVARDSKLRTAWHVKEQLLARC
jgi:hypothetical protein